VSLSLSSYTNTTYTQKMDSLLPRVSPDSKGSVSPSSVALALDPENTIKAKEWRRLTAIDYLSKIVTAIPVDRNKSLPPRPISVVGSVHSHVSVEGDVVGQGVSPPPPLALAAISEEDLEGGGTCEADGPSSGQRANEDDGKQADIEKDALPVTPRASSNHRRSMTLPLQAMPQHLNLALGLPSSPSLGSSKAGEVSLQAEKDGQVFSTSGEANTEDSPSDLRPTSDIPHITALAELAASIVGEHPDAPPILERVASLTLTSPLPLFVDPSPLALSPPHTLTPTPTYSFAPIQNYIPHNHNQNQRTSKFAWAGNTHRTTFGLVTRANVPPTPPRLAMFVGVGSGDGGCDVGFRSNAGGVVWAGQKQRSLGADTGIVLVQTSLDLGKGMGARARASANANPNGNLAGNAAANANGNWNANATANANTNANGNSNAAASPDGNANANPLANANPNTTANPYATSSPDVNANSTVVGPELLEKEREAVSELQVQVHEGQVESEGQVQDCQVRKDIQVEKEDQMGKEGQVEQESLVAKEGQVEKEEKVVSEGAIGKTSTPVQPGTTTTTGRPPAPVQITSRSSASVQISSRLTTPVQSARLVVPLRPTRGKENRYLAGEAPRSVQRPPSHLRNVLCAI
jgi:hypothetical protein